MKKIKRNRILCALFALAFLFTLTLTGCELFDWGWEDDDYYYYSDDSGSYGSSGSGSSGRVTCSGCRGTGRCTAPGCVNGKVKSSSYYTGGGTIISNCGTCRGSGKCGVCYGKGYL